jgi:CRP/FNR family transcriptional regulator, cyclic AMP receptor protein
MVEAGELTGFKVFADLNERELAEVAKLGTIEKRGAGSRIITEGTNAAAWYLLKQGKVAVRMTSRSGHEVVIDELGPGDMFGWSAVLDHQMFKADVWALEDCTIIAMDGAKLKALFDSNNHIGYRAVRVVADVVASRLERLRARLVDQPFSQQYLAPVRTQSTPVAGEKSEMRAMKCPECSTPNRPFAVVNDTEQHRCKNCGMVYYSPVGCETGPATPSADRSPKEASSLGANWSASSPSRD